MDPTDLYEKHMEDQRENAVKLKEHGVKIGELEKKVKDLENSTDALNKLAYSVETMCEELKKQGERIEHLEQQPADRWNKLVDTAIACIATGVIGYFIGTVL